MTPKMQKYQNTTGKRETSRPYEMRYPQWNTCLNTRVRVLIDENGRTIKYDREVTGSI